MKNRGPGVCQSHGFRLYPPACAKAVAIAAPKIQDLAAGRDGGKPGGRAKLPHNQQVDRAIGRLQKERPQHREHEQRQLFQDAALRKIVIQG